MSDDSNDTIEIGRRNVPATPARREIPRSSSGVTTARECRSVLCVDDDPDICVVVQTALCLLAGMDVHIACSGEMAIDIAYEKRPDLIVLDVMMPGLDGPATFARIRESPLIADTPIVFMTARVMPSEIDSLMELGAIGVIGKPFDPLRLGAELTALWNQASATREVSARRDGQGEVLAQVDALAERFVERTRDDVDRLRMLARCARSDGRPALKEIERIAHSIHGAGLMFGFAAVSKLGAAIEHLAGSWLMGPEPTAVPGDSTALRLNQLTEQLSRVLGRAPRKSATVFGRPGATAKPT